MKTKKKFYVTDYHVITPSFKSDIKEKIMVISDMHYQTSVNRDLFEILIEYAKETNPSVIIMPGDQIETIDFIDEEDNRNFFENIIKELSKVAPVIMIPGNHEIKNFDRENFKNRLNSSSDINTKALEYFKGLTKFENVYFLNNEQITINGINFLGFSPRLSTYQKMNDKKTEEEFVEDYINSKFKVNKNNYNILLTHSPLYLTNQNVLNSIPEFNLIDLVITGHFHDGYLPKKLDRLFGKTNAGLFFTPMVLPYPGLVCRGMNDFKRGYLFVSQGYRKWTADIKLFNAFEKITANDIENIIIKKGNEKSFSSSTYKPYCK